MKQELTGSHNTFCSGGSDGLVSLWDHLTKKRMKQYPKFATSVSCLAFSPDGSKLAIGCSNEHDNSLPPVGEESGRVALMIKDTVMEDCKARHILIGVERFADSLAKSKGIGTSDCRVKMVRVIKGRE